MTDSNNKTDYMDKLRNCEEFFWVNPGFVPAAAGCADAADNANAASAASDASEQIVDIDDAEARLLRFAPFIERMFPEVAGGIIESPLTELTELAEIAQLAGVPELANRAELADASELTNRAELAGASAQGRVFVKQDSHLPISGSIKARGGIYEVLKLAETLAVEAGLLHWDPQTGEHDDYGKLGDPEMKEFFSKYKVAVGSTGNLGLSIGIISAAIGFEVTVHMSADARQWKKDMLRSKGVTVVEYPDDYEAAVAQGRREAQADPTCHFVDDENSLDLFAGYSVAGRRLKRQLDALGVKVDKDHRMYVYLPCGVGGAPGGVTYGIRDEFGEGAYCFFAEPTHAPCMTLGLISGKLNEIAVGDIGIDGKTEADGLAVGRPSGLVAKAMQTMLSGCFTVEDEKLYPYLAALKDSAGIFIEPSACAAFEGLRYLCNGEIYSGGSNGGGGEAFVPAPDENSIHVIWATGGNMVPEDEKTAYYERGKK